MKPIIAAAALALAATLGLSLSAQAQNGSLPRSFVSSSGLDSNPCTITEPCATFAHAYTAVGANGVVAALDPGKYGPLTITGPVTINGNGWAAITEPAGSNGITITAASGNVTLKGLEIDGAGAGSSGVTLNSALSGDLNLSILGCVISNSTGTGIAIVPTASSGSPLLNLLMTNTSSFNNMTGISIVPSGNASVAGTITGMNVANNSNNGFNIGGSSALAIVNSLASQNSNDGINATGGNTTVTLKGSTVVNNIVGVNIASGATVVSYGNNAITGNQTNVVGGSIPELGAVGPAGPTGPQGPTGAMGVAGAQGPQGATGAMGAAGAQGAQGPAGTNGATGATGAQGAQGPQGPEGTTGIVSFIDIGGDGIFDASSSSYVFSGPTASIVLTQTLNITVTATTVFYTIQGGAQYSYAICQSSGGGTPTVAGGTLANLEQTAQNSNIPTTTSATFTLSTPGTYQVGSCTSVGSGTIGVGSNSGWVMVTN